MSDDTSDTSNKFANRFHIAGLILVIFISDVVEIASIARSQSKGFGSLCLHSWHTDYCGFLPVPVKTCAINSQNTFCDFTSIDAQNNPLGFPCLYCIAQQQQQSQTCFCTNTVECSFNATNPAYAFTMNSNSIPSKTQQYPTDGTLCVYSATGRGFTVQETFALCYDESVVEQDEVTEQNGETFESIFFATSIINVLLLAVAVANNLLHYINHHINKGKKKKSAPTTTTTTTKFLEKSSPYIDIVVFFPVSCFSLIHVALHSLIFVSLNTFGVTCYQDAYYLVVGGRSLSLAIALIDTAIAVFLLGSAISELIKRCRGGSNKASGADGSNKETEAVSAES